MKLREKNRPTKDNGRCPYVATANDHPVEVYLVTH